MNDSAQARVALVAFNSLGDGLIYLMMAENLRINGYAVTYFGNIGYQLRHWLPQFEIRPYPTLDEMDAALADFDLVVMCPPQFLRNRMDPVTTDAMRRKWILICQKPPAEWRFDLRKEKSSTIHPEIYAALERLLDCGGPIRRRKYTTESVVDITIEYMRDIMGLKTLVRDVPLAPPGNLEFRKYPQRIIISPDSAWPEKKDWSPQAFLKLCHKLRSLGAEPKIVVAPGNHERWKTMPGNCFDTPLFPAIENLASYIFESGAVIANDSGNGHLASFLGIPVVTIYRKKNPKFHWRPDWKPAKVVCPRIVLPGIRKPIWRPFISVSDVLKALHAVT